MDKLTKDSIVTVDYETIELRPDGSTVASMEFYRENFRVDSCAFGWYDDQRQFQCVFTRGEDETRNVLCRLSDIGCRLICHNYQFELGVTKCRFPDAKLNWYADTMRMAQNYDNGGDEYAVELIHVEADEFHEEDVKKVPLSGFSLVKCMKRIMNREDHKKPAHDWIKKNVPGVKAGKEGMYLNKLPEDILRAYNEADVKATLDLYEFLEADFVAQDFDWQFDHHLFMELTKHVVDAQIRGVYVDRTPLQQNVVAIGEGVAKITQTFENEFKQAMIVVEQLKAYKFVNAKKKTIRGRINAVKKILQDDKTYQKHIKFNAGSNTQLQMMFVDVLKIEPEFFTAKGSPAFRSALLGQWGQGGLLLNARRKELLVKQQCENLLDLTEYDGRWHLSLKIVGTRTGRAAGGKH